MRRRVFPKPDLGRLRGIYATELERRRKAAAAARAPFDQFRAEPTDIVSLHYWERETFDAGWVALRANGSVLTDQERRVSGSRDVIVSCDASRAGIVMVRADGGLRDLLHGAKGMTHVVGRLFPPGKNGYAVWIEEEAK